MQCVTQKRSKRAKQDPDHETHVEVEKRCDQSREVSGFPETFGAHLSPRRVVSDLALNVYGVDRCTLTSCDEGGRVISCSISVSKPETSSKTTPSSTRRSEERRVGKE